MHFPNNVFAIILIISGLVTMGISWMVFKKSHGAVRCFAYAMFLIALWAITYGCELSSDTLDQMMFWVNIEYLSIALLPPLWAVFVIGFTGKEKWLTPLNLTLLFSIGVITLLMVWTNPLHHLYYISVSVYNKGPFPLLEMNVGPWYRVHTIYFYCLLGGGLFFIAARFRKADAFIKKQNRIILLGAIIPWLVNMAYLAGIRPFGHLDLTPFAFMALSLIIAIGLLGFKLFDIVPIARGKVFDALQEGVLVLDARDRVIDINLAMRKIIGPAIDNIIGKSIAHLFPNQTELINTVYNSHENGRVALQLNDGRFFSVTLTSLFENKTIYSGKIMMFRDITDRTEAEQKLKELNQLKDRLFSIISHDLRSPLLSLMDILNMANDGMVSDEEFKGYLPTLSKNIGYTSGLVENLLQWSKSQLEGTAISSVHFDIKDIAAHIVNSFAQAAAEKGIVLENNIDSRTTVYADTDMIQAVLRNLVSNAIKFCHQGDRIAISANIQPNQVTVCIADTGVGIAAENIDKLFSTHNFSTRGTLNEQGTGLGLLLCKDFVEKNGGTIWVESKIGEGSSFYFSLPVAPKQV